VGHFGIIAAMRISSILVTALLMVACKGGANPADCTEKRDAKACQKLCESGKENKHFCYAERAFKVADCVDKGQGCDEACKDWSTYQKGAAMGDTGPSDLLKANIGDKYDQMASKCGAPAGSAAGSGAPAGSAAGSSAP
jgi:hypothetical protein